MKLKSLQERSKEFALHIILKSRELPRTLDARELGRRILRNGTRMAAKISTLTYVRGQLLFIHRLTLALQDLDQVQLWCDLVIDSQILSAEKLQDLRDEAHALARIIKLSIRHAKRRFKK
ncbi:MAG: four helix bundle protein [Pirellulales bacterium]|nr:four helix bundle protein [Pirellulales bacterium]